MLKQGAPVNSVKLKIGNGASKKEGQNKPDVFDVSDAVNQDRGFDFTGDKDKYLSLIEASKYTKFSQDYLSLMARTGRMPARKFGRNWKVRMNDIEEYIAKIDKKKSQQEIKKAVAESAPAEKKIAKIVNAIASADKEIYNPLAVRQLTNFSRHKFQTVMASFLIVTTVALTSLFWLSPTYASKLENGFDITKDKVVAVAKQAKNYVAAKTKNTVLTVLKHSDNVFKKGEEILNNSDDSLAGETKKAGVQTVLGIQKIGEVASQSMAFLESRSAKRQDYILKTIDHSVKQAISQADNMTDDLRQAIKQVALAPAKIIPTPVKQLTAQSLILSQLAITSGTEKLSGVVSPSSPPAGGYGVAKQGQVAGISESADDSKESIKERLSATVNNVAQKQKVLAYKIHKQSNDNVYNLQSMQKSAGLALITTARLTIAKAQNYVQHKITQGKSVVQGTQETADKTTGQVWQRVDNSLLALGNGIDTSLIAYQNVVDEETDKSKRSISRFISSSLDLFLPKAFKQKLALLQSQPSIGTGETVTITSPTTSDSSATSGTIPPSSSAKASTDAKAMVDKTEDKPTATDSIEQVVIEKIINVSNVADGLTVDGDADVKGKLIVNDNLIVFGSADLRSPIYNSDSNLIIDDSVDINKYLTVGKGTGAEITIGVDDGNSYINFGDDVSGEQGFGFRSRAGFIQYKNESGSWISLSSLAHSGGGGGSVTNNTYNTTNNTTDGTVTSSSIGQVAYYNATGDTVIGTSELYIDTTGYIGIGTTSPAVVLDIYSTNAIRLPVGTTAQRPTGGTGMLRFNSTTSGFEGYNGNAWSGLGGVIDVDQDTYILSELSSASDEDALFFYTDSTEKMRLTANGYLGIGTSSPSAMLTVWATSTGATLFSAVDTASTTLFTILNSGYVGIGTTSPNHTLDINGNLGLKESQYINWGYTDGSSGYGLRDNSGTIEYKASGGTWAAIGSGGGSNYGAASSLSFYSVSGTTATGTTNALLSWDDTNTRLGVGTSTAYATLSVWGNTSGTGAELFNIVDNASTTLLTVLDTGNVGIGTTSPWGVLSVDAPVAKPAFVIGSSTTSFIVDANGYVGIGTANPNSLLNLFQTPADLSDNPTLSFGDGDTGFYETADDALNLSINTILRYAWTDTAFTGTTNDGFYLLRGAGSAATPSYAFVGNEDTGIYSDTANYLQFSTGASNRMTINDSGYIGIGTSTPYSRLTIWGDGGNILEVVDNASSTKMVITNAGNVGIGTTSPLYKFSMNSGTNGFGIDSSGIVQQGTWQGTTIATAKGGTGLTSYVIGDIIYADATNSLARLATSTAGKILQLDFTTGLPSYVATSTLNIALTNTTGTLAVNRGGTGLSSTPSYGQVLLGNASSGYTLTATTSLGLVADTDFTSNGIMIRTSDGAYANRTLATSSDQIIILDPDGVSGAPTFNLRNTAVTSLANLATVGTITAGTWNADTITTTKGGTGLTSYVIGDIIYADVANSLARLATSTAGKILQLDFTTGLPSYVATSSLGLLGSSTVSALTANYLPKWGGSVFSNSILSDDGIKIGISSSSPWATLSVHHAAGTNAFAVGSSTATTFLVDVNGDVGLKASSYLNWGTTMGTNGYGLKDNSGTLQYKNSAGNWTDMGAGSGTVNYGAASSLAFYSASGTTATGTTNALLSWDDTNTRLGVGTSTAYATLSVWGKTSGTGMALFNVVDTASTTLLTVLDTGRIGIGTTTPTAKLTIQGTAGQDIFTIASSTGATIMTINSQGKLVLNSTSGSSDYEITPNDGLLGIDGYLGVGTSTPAQVLSVVGSGYFTAGIYFGDGTFMNTASSSNGWQLIGSATVSLQSNSYNVGIGTSTPYSKLTVWGDTSNSSTTIFNVINNASTTILTIMDNGFVGIGTTSPSVSFAIDATDGMVIPVGTTAQRPGSAYTGMLRYNTTTSGFEGYGGGNWSGLGGVIDVDSDTYILSELSSASDEDALFFYTGSTEKMRLTNNGYLGIGTSSPSSLLTIWATSTGATLFSAVDTASTTLFTILNSGNVGIGTTSPWAQLSVDAPAGKSSFVIGSSTATSFIVNNNGNTHVGTNKPVQDRQFTVTDLAADGNIFAMDIYAPNKAQDGSGIFLGIGKAFSTGNMFQVGMFPNTTAANAYGQINLYGGAAILKFKGDDTISTTANVGINNTTPALDLVISGAAADAPFTGATPTGSFSVGGGNTYMHFGAVNATGRAWIQANNISDLSVFRDIQMQPHGGDISIGVSTSTDPGSRLHIKGTASNALLIEDDNAACEAQPETGGLTWACSSDERLKEDISVTTTSFIDYFKGIPLYDYTLKSTGERILGQIAQETIKNYPELVSIDDTIATTTEDLEPYLRVSAISQPKIIRAIQELIQQNEDFLPLSNNIKIDGSGNVGIGTTTPSANLDIAIGATTEADTWTARGADYAEYYYSINTDLHAGEVVCVDVEQDNAVKRCERGADGNVMGIVSTDPAIVGNSKGYQNNANYAIVGMLGQVPTKVSDENGSIRPGDSLTSSELYPGHAMKAGAGDPTVGVALENLTNGTGEINVLISRRNKSMTVEQVEQTVIDRIAAMEIEDEVAILVANAVDGYDFNPVVIEIIGGELALLSDNFDSQLTVQQNELTNLINSSSATLDTKLSAITATVNANGEVILGLQEESELLNGYIVELLRQREQVTITSNSTTTILTVEQNGAGNIAEFKNASSTILAIMAGRNSYSCSDQQSDCPFEAVVKIADNMALAFGDNEEMTFAYNSSTGRVEVLGTEKDLYIGLGMGKMIIAGAYENALTPSSQGGQATPLPEGEGEFALEVRGSSRIETHASSTATALTVQQNGSGNIVEFRNATIAVMTIKNEGGVEVAGGNLEVCVGACPDTESFKPTNEGDLGVEASVFAQDYRVHCPEGWVEVPRDNKHTFQNFCVMKTEVLAQIDTDLNTDENGARMPMTNVTLTEAKNYCRSLGTGNHLVTDAEWMTIAEQITNLPINDVSDEVGMQLANGATSPPTPLLVKERGDDDPNIDGCNLYVNLAHADNAFSETCQLQGTNGDTADFGYTDTNANFADAYNVTASSKASLRTAVLSNGQIIWDIAGNVAEWVDELSNADEQPVDATPASEWLEYGAITKYANMSYIRPSGYNWTSANGIGQIYSDYDAGSATRGSVRGGSYLDGEKAGVFGLDLSHAPSDISEDVGFRCAK